ncbi:MAG TPA: hypothetical protein VH593_32790 [Ktedonobacteraceae bacterium]
MMETPFQDIRITGLATNKSHDFPLQDGTQRLYLTLSAVPSTTWREIFDHESSRSRHSIRREASIEGAFLVICCTPEQLEKHHFACLKVDVKHTNEKFRLLVAQQEEQSARFYHIKEEQNKRLEEVRDRLQFD